MKNKKLSKVDKNKKLLHKMQSVDNQENFTEEIKESNKLSIREFKCECGFSVRLEGSLAKDLSITKCSKCNSK